MSSIHFPYVQKSLVEKFAGFSEPNRRHECTKKKAMFFLLFSKALCDKSNTDITSREIVNSGNCKFTNCQFKDFGDSVRAFEFSESQITLEVKSCTFINFRTSNSDGAVFYHNDRSVMLDFEKVDITSCYANGIGGAFYYKSSKDIAAPHFSEVTIYGCSCFNRVFYIQGNEKGTLLFMQYVKM